MSFYDMKEQLYQETDALGIGLGAHLLHVKASMWFPRNEAPNNEVLLPIAFVHENLLSSETHFSSIEREVLSILQGLYISTTTVLSVKSAW